MLECENEKKTKNETTKIRDKTKKLDMIEVGGFNNGVVNDKYIYYFFEY